MLPEFENIGYLIPIAIGSGSPIQQKTHNILEYSKILYHLHPFNPVLTGTLPLDLFIAGKSDLDIICQSDDFKSVEKILLDAFAGYSGFSMQHKKMRAVPTLICRFEYETVPFEIFCQATDPKKQLAYRHMLIECRLLQQGGDKLKRKVMELKAQGIKTEPAFAMILGLPGDPYEALLALEE